MRERAAQHCTTEVAQALLQQAQESLYQDKEALQALQAEAALCSAKQAHHRELVAELHAHATSLKVRSFAKLQEVPFDMSGCCFVNEYVVCGLHLFNMMPPGSPVSRGRWQRWSGASLRPKRLGRKRNT